MVILFAAETGGLLALVHYLLGAELNLPPRASASGCTGRGRGPGAAALAQPALLVDGRRSRTHVQLDQLVYPEPAAGRLLLPTTQTQRRSAVQQAAYSLDCFLKDYGPDGCCNEGAQYYRHAGLHCGGALEVLGTIAPAVFRPLFREKKIHNIAEYICAVHVQGPYYLNFGDCSPLAGRCGAREFRFGQAVDSPALCALAAEDLRADPDPERLQNQDRSSQINLWYRLLTAFAQQEMEAYTADAPQMPTVWYPVWGSMPSGRGHGSWGKDGLQWGQP